MYWRLYNWHKNTSPRYFEGVVSQTHSDQENQKNKIDWSNYFNWLLKLNYQVVITEKISTVIVVWMPSLNWQRFWRFDFSVFNLHSRQCFIGYPNLEFRQKHFAVHRIFNSFFGVWIPNETLSLVFDIWHKNCLAKLC